MKNFIVLTAIAFLATTQLIHAEAYYNRPNCTVIEVKGDLVTVEDTAGNLWEFYGEGYEKYDRVNLRMHTNHTNTFEDDIVVEVK